MKTLAKKLNEVIEILCDLDPDIDREHAEHIDSYREAVESLDKIQSKIEEE